jgi:hypothetical protein
MYADREVVYMVRKAVRIGDMHPTRALEVSSHDSGDFIIRITQDGITVGNVDTGDPKERSAAIEFCVSGGRSPNTKKAIEALLEAMEKDNSEHPIVAKK